MEDEKKDGCCSGKKCCCAKKLIALIMAVLIFASGYFVGKNCGYCPMGQKACPMMQAAPK